MVWRAGSGETRRTTLFSTVSGSESGPRAVRSLFYRSSVRTELKVKPRLTEDRMSSQREKKWKSE